MSSRNHAADGLKDTGDVLKAIVESSSHKATAGAAGGGIFTAVWEWFYSGFSELSSVGAIGLFLTILSIAISFLSYRLRVDAQEEESRRKREQHELQIKILEKKLNGGE